MDTDLKWVVVRIDGKIAAVSTDYRMLSDIASKLAGQKTPQHLNVSAETVGFDYIWSLRKSSRWEDFMLFGTAFQKKVWQKLYELTHVHDNCGEQKAIGRGLSVFYAVSRHDTLKITVRAVLYVHSHVVNKAVIDERLKHFGICAVGVKLYLKAARLYLGRDLGDNAFAVVGCFVKYKSVCHNIYSFCFIEIESL